MCDNTPVFFTEMKVGDSVLLPECRRAYECPELAMARRYGKETGKKFTSKRAHPKGIRIWRIA